MLLPSGRSFRKRALLLAPLLELRKYKRPKVARGKMFIETARALGCCESEEWA
jgi:hypothetical protein